MGKDCRVYLGSRDASGDLSNVTLKASSDPKDATTYASNGNKEAQNGLLQWELDVNGFYDGVAGEIGQQFETLLGAAGGIITLVTSLANGIGDVAIVLSDAILAERDQPQPVADLIRLAGKFRPASGVTSGKAGLYGVLLHVLGVESATGNSASVDNGGASANGGRMNLHITAATGTGGTIKVQDSADNSSFADLANFTAASAPGVQTVEIAGTIRRYTREVHTINGASSLTYVAALARY